MNSTTFLRAVVVIFSVYAVAAVAALVLYAGDAGFLITTLTTTFTALITILAAKQLADSNAVVQATQAKVETVAAKVDSVQEATISTAALTQQVAVAQETLAQVAVAAAQETTAISTKVDETHALVNGASHETKAMASLIADLEKRLAVIYSYQDGARAGAASGRAQAETEAALLAQQPPAVPVS